MRKLKEYINMYIIVNLALLCLVFFLIYNAGRIFELFVVTTSELISALSPLFIGLIIAYIISPLVNVVEHSLTSKFIFSKSSDPIKKYRLSRKSYFISILITFLIIVFFIVSLIFAFAVLVSGTINVGNLQESILKIDYYISGIQEKADEIVASIPSSEIRTSAENFFNYIIQNFTGSISGRSVFNYITNLSGDIINFALGVVVSIYLLNDQDFFKRLLRKTMHLTLPQKTNAIVTETVSEINEVLSLFLRGAALDALIVALLSSAALSVYGLEFSVLIGSFAGLVNVIPYFGPFIGMVPAFIVGFFTESFSFALGTIAVIFIIQQLDSNIIYPKIVGRSTGLHPLFVLVSVSFLGYFFGIAGMILAVPFAGIIKVLIARFIIS
ncbi:MAG: AI-2E family transporter [Firmicutes bacterium]|nr:AI-2E family transporter [Bacillota bacterium]